MDHDGANASWGRADRNPASAALRVQRRHPPHALMQGAVIQPCSTSVLSWESGDRDPALLLNTHREK